MPHSLEAYGLTQRWFRVIPVAFIMYTISFIDRTNISLALPHISRDLHLDPVQAGSVAGVFYAGYWLLQIPGGHLAKHWSAKRFISVLMVVWGASAVGCGLARSGHELMIMRVLLGVAEGGVFPATLILLSHWFSRAERARANAFWLMCLPGAVIISSPVSGWILDHWNWRVMMIAEGALPILWLAVWLLFIEDHPSEVRWLASADRERLALTLNQEAAVLESAAPVSYLRALPEAAGTCPHRRLSLFHRRPDGISVLASQRHGENRQAKQSIHRTALHDSVHGGRGCVAGEFTALG